MFFLNNSPLISTFQHTKKRSDRTCHSEHSAFTSDFIITVKIKKNRTPEIFAVIALKFEQGGLTVE